MKAAVVVEANRPWEIRDVPTPQPDPNQVLIRIRASGICYTDVHQTRGELPVRFPRILGHEPVGEIVAVGSAVRGRQVGDRVGVPALQDSCRCCEWCRRGKALFCGEVVWTSFQIDGGHAEYMLARAEATTLLPENLAYDQAAPILCAGYTVWSGLRIADPQPGERVAVLGIGGLGHLAVQYARAAGFETIAVTHSADKVALVRDLGADGVVSDGAALRDAGGADVILATSNSMAATGQCLPALRPDGRLVLMGFSATEKFEVPSSILFTRARIIGSQQNHPEYLYEALRIAGEGKVQACIETYALDDIVRAYERVEQGAVRFRAVVTMD